MASAATGLAPDSVSTEVAAQLTDSETRTLDQRGEEASVTVRAPRNPHV